MKRAQGPARAPAAIIGPGTHFRGRRHPSPRPKSSDRPIAGCPRCDKACAVNGTSEDPERRRPALPRGIRLGDLNPERRTVASPALRRPGVRCIRGAAVRVRQRRSATQAGGGRRRAGTCQHAPRRHLEREDAELVGFAAAISARGRRGGRGGAGGGTGTAGDWRGACRAGLPN